MHSMETPQTRVDHPVWEMGTGEMRSLYTNTPLAGNTAFLYKKYSPA